MRRARSFSAALVSSLLARNGRRRRRRAEPLVEDGIEQVEALLQLLASRVSCFEPPRAPPHAPARLRCCGWATSSFGAIAPSRPVVRQRLRAGLVLSPPSRSRSRAAAPARAPARRAPPRLRTPTRAASAAASARAAPPWSPRQLLTGVRFPEPFVARSPPPRGTSPRPCRRRSPSHFAGRLPATAASASLGALRAAASSAHGVRALVLDLSHQGERPPRPRASSVAAQPLATPPARLRARRRRVGPLHLHLVRPSPPRASLSFSVRLDGDGIRQPRKLARGACSSLVHRRGRLRRHQTSPALQSFVGVRAAAAPRAACRSRSRALISVRSTCSRAADPALELHRLRDRRAEAARTASRSASASASRAPALLAPRAAPRRWRAACPSPRQGSPRRRLPPPRRRRARLELRVLRAELVEAVAPRRRSRPAAPQPPPARPPAARSAR